MNDALHNTISLVACVEMASIPLAMGLALLLERTALPCRRLIWVMILGLLFVPLYIQGAAWDAGFGLQGWWTYRAEGSVEPWLSGRRAVVWIHSCAALPWATLLVAGGLRLVSRPWEELARLEAGPWRVLARVTLPRAWPGVAAAVLWVAVMTAGEMAVADMYQVRTYAEAIYLDQAAGADLVDLTWGAGWNLAVVGLMIAGAAFTAWMASAPRTSVPRGEPWRIELGRWSGPLAAGVLVLVAGLWLVPLVNLAYNAGVEVRDIAGQRVRTWTVAAAANQIAAAPRNFRDEFYWTAIVGAGAASLVVAVIAPLAWQVRRSPAVLVVGCIVTTLAWAIPSPLLSLLLIKFRDVMPGSWVVWLFDDTVLVLMAVHAWRAAPIVWLMLIDALRGFPQAEWEQAAVAGAAPLRRWFTLVVPRRIGALLAAWLVAWGISLAEVATSLIVAPQGVATLAVRTSQLVHTGVDDRLAGLTLVTIAIAWVMAAATVWLGTQGAKREPSGSTDV